MCKIRAFLLNRTVTSSFLELSEMDILHIAISFSPYDNIVSFSQEFEFFVHWNYWQILYDIYYS